MCEPATVATVLMATGTIMQGVSAKQQGDFQYGVSKYNARQLENEAIQTRTVGIEEENRKREQTAQQLARQRVRMAASNIELGSGTAQQLQENTLDIGEIDALRIRRNFDLQAQSMEDQAELTRAEGKAARRAGNVALGTSVLTAAAGGLSSPGGQAFASKWFGGNSVALAGTPTFNSAFAPV